MKKVIGITVGGRMEYFTQIVESLAVQEGIGEWECCFSIEPGPSARPAKALCEERLPRVNAWINGNRLGPYNNPRMMITRLYNELDADVVFYSEEDLLLAPDALRMVDWWYALPNRDDYMAIGLHNYVSRADRMSEFDDTIVYAFTSRNYLPLHAAFISLGYACTRALFEQRFIHTVQDPFGPLSNFIWTEYPERLALTPAVSRTKHIGRHNGAHTNDAAYFGFQDPVVLATSERPEYRIVPGSECSALVGLTSDWVNELSRTAPIQRRRKRSRTGA